MSALLDGGMKFFDTVGDDATVLDGGDHEPGRGLSGSANVQK